MGLKLGDEFPDFTAETSDGPISSFHEWIGDSWAILFSHPADFTPVCTTELARAAQLAPEFQKRGVKLIALSCDSVESHREWAKDVLGYCRKTGTALAGAGGECCSSDKLPFPIIADERRELATQLEMLDPEEKDAKGLPLTVRAVFVLDPTKRLKLSILYPANTGRNFDEILRVVDSVQLTAKNRVATPVDWEPGNECMVQPTLSNEEAAQMFGAANIRTVSVPSGKEYIRLTPHPQYLVTFMRTFLLLRRIQRSQICQLAVSTSLASPSDSAHPNNATSKQSKKRSKEKALVVKPSRERATKAKDMPVDAHEEVPLSKVFFEDVFKSRSVYECMLCESKTWFASMYGSADASSRGAPLRTRNGFEEEVLHVRNGTSDEEVAGSFSASIDAHSACMSHVPDVSNPRELSHTERGILCICEKWSNVYIDGGMTAEVWHYMTQYAREPDLAPPCESLESGDNCVYAILHPDAAHKHMPAEKRIVYYGITDNILRRMSSHCNDGNPSLIRIDRPSKTVHYIVLAEKLSRSAAEELERILVYSHKPGLLKNTDFPKVDVPFTKKCRFRAAAYVAATVSGRIPVNKYPTREPKLEPKDVDSHAWRAMLEAARRGDLLMEDALLSSLSVSLRPRSIVLRPEFVHPLMAQPDCPNSLVASDPMVDDAIVPVLSSEAEKEHFRWVHFTPRQWAMVAAFAVAFTLTLAVVVLLLV
ncbi:1-Cys peroxiredoxin [Aphelenchoides avenae]|nr:1-Cys peroxiredoxin [Aphelenchus avenae]